MIDDSDLLYQSPDPRMVIAREYEAAYHAVYHELAPTVRFRGQMYTLDVHGRSYTAKTMRRKIAKLREMAAQGRY